VKIKLDPITLLVIVWPMMLCEEKTPMQLLLEGSVGKSEDSQGRPKNSEPSGETVSSEADRRKREYNQQYYLKHRDAVLAKSKRDFKNQEYRRKISDQKKKQREKLKGDPERLARRQEYMRQFSKEHPKPREESLESNRKWKAKLMADPKRLSEYRMGKRLAARERHKRLKNDPAYQTRIRAQRKAYRLRAADKLRAYFKIWQRDKRRNDPLYKIRYALSMRLWKWLGAKKCYATSRTKSLLGCSIQDLKTHLEKQWTEGMTWDNHGKGAGFWNIDHIVPCAAFNLRDLEQQKQCFHYTNLRPLWHVENTAKSSKHNGKRWTYKDHQESCATS
jgi:hypothetical protein